MADISGLSDIIQKLAYVQSGGLENERNQRDYENLLNTFGAVNQGTANLMNIRSQIVNDTIKKKQAQIADEENKIKNMPITELYSPQIQADLKKAEQAPIPVEDLISGRLDTRQQNIEAQKQRALDLQSKYGNRTIEQEQGLANIEKTRMEKPVNLNAMPVSQVFPHYTENDLQEKFGSGISGSTPYIAAIKLADLEEKRKINAFKREKADRVFPIKGLTEEAQVKAINAGFGPFVTEGQARLLNAGTLPKAANAEEIKDIANFDTMTRQFDKASKLFDKVGQDAVGVENYYINRIGQFAPIDALKTDTDIVKFYQQLNDINNQIIYLRSGKQINETEYERLKETFPTPNLNPEAFKARLDTFIETFNDIKSTRRQAIESSGKRLNVPRLKDTNEGFNQSSQDILDKYLGKK